MKYTQEEESLLSSIYIKCEIEQQRDTNILYNSIENYFERTPGYSGADLENLLNEAALLAVRRNKTSITMEEIEGENLGEQINSKVSYIIS